MNTLSPLVQVEVGSVLRLDCPVSQLVGGQRAGVMLWKKGHRVLTAGSIKVSHPSHVSNGQRTIVMDFRNCNNSLLIRA